MAGMTFEEAMSGPTPPPGAISFEEAMGKPPTPPGAISFEDAVGGGAAPSQRPISFEEAVGSPAQEAPATTLPQQVGTDVPTRQRVIELARRNPGFADAPSFFIDQTRQRLGLPTEQEAMTRVEADRFAREAPVRAGITHLVEGAQDTIEQGARLAGLATSDKGGANLSQSIADSFQQQHPNIAMATGVAGAALDPAFLALGGLGGKAVQGLAATGKLGRLGTAAAGQGVKGFAARRALDVAAGAPADAITGAIKGGADGGLQEAGRRALTEAGEGAVLGPLLGSAGEAVSAIPSALRRIRTPRGSTPTTLAQEAVQPRVSPAETPPTSSPMPRPETPQRAPQADPEPAFSGIPGTPEALDRATGAVSRATGEQAAEASGGARREFGSMIGRVRSFNTPSAKQAAERAERAVDFAAQARGQMSQSLDRALRTAGANPLSKRGRAVSDLAKDQRVEGQNYGLAPLRQTIEGRAQPGSPEAQEAVDAARALIDSRGQAFEQAKIRQIDPATGEPRPFQRKGDKIAPRIMTGEFHDLIEKGGSDPAYQTMVDAFAHASDTPREQVESIFKQMRDDMVGEGPDAAISRTQAEYVRQFRDIPDVLYVGNRRIPLTETSLYSYAQRLAEQGANRVGVVRAFGQDIGNETPVSTLRGQFAKETGDAKPFVEMMRGLSGISVEGPKIRPGSRTATTVRGINSAVGVAKESILSLSAVPNVFEPLGATREFTGNLNMLRGAAKLLKSPAETVAALEQMGAITKSVANLSIDPQRPYTSFARGLRQVMSRLSTREFVEEFGEKLAAASTLAKVENMKAGKAGTADVLDLRGIGYSLEDARRIAGGKGTQAEYDAIVRKAPQMLVGSNLNRAQQSRFENRRWVRKAIAFQHYAQTTIRRTANLSKTYIETMDDAIRGKGLTDAERWRLGLRANTKLMNHLAGRAAGGVGAYFALAFMTGGTEGLEVAWNEAKDRPIGFVRDATIYSLFAGPYGAILHNIGGGIEGIEDFAAQAIFPIFLAKEMGQAVSNTGRYDGLGWGETVDQLTDRLVPVKRVFTEGAAGQALNKVGEKLPQSVVEGVGVSVFGSEKVRELDVATRAYWRWRFDEYAPPDFEKGDVSERNKQFSSNMRRAYKALRSGETPQEVHQHVVAALEGGGKDGRNIAASLRGKRLLTKGDIAPGESDQVYRQRLKELRSRIGDDAYRNIQAHDKMLDWWASRYSR